jgi:hypothetical protein
MIMKQPEVASENSSKAVTAGKFVPKPKMVNRRF